jgi:hypothetical protein
MAKEFTENHTPISGQPIGASSVSSDISDGMRRHEGCAEAWESVTDAIHNNEFRTEYKPIMRGPNKK